MRFGEFSLYDAAGVELTAPVKIGQVVIPNVAGTNANIVVTKNL